MVDSIEERHNAEVRAKEAQIAVDIAMTKLVKTSEALDAALLSVADQAKAVDRFVAVLENRTSKIEASRVDEIDDITAIANMSKFAQQVREVACYCTNRRKFNIKRCAYEKGGRCSFGI